MRRSSIFALLATSALAACNIGGTNRLVQPAAGHVEMTLTCFSDGTLGVDLAPWAVTLPDQHASFTLVNSKNSTVAAVVAGKPNADPFRGATFTTPNSGKLILAKPAVGDSGTYHYSVTATCPIAGGSKTTVIDPDMIIPWKVTD